MAAVLVVAGAALDLWLLHYGHDSRDPIYVVAVAVANLVLLVVGQTVARRAVRVVCGILAIAMNGISGFYLVGFGIAVVLVLGLQGIGGHHPSQLPLLIVAVAGLVRVGIIVMASLSFAFASPRRHPSKPHAQVAE